MDDRVVVTDEPCCDCDCGPQLSAGLRLLLNGWATSQSAAAGEASPSGSDSV